VKKEWILAIAFVLFVFIFKITYHELWKDEWQAWILTRDMTFVDLLSFLNYEGHPSFWYIYLKPFTFIASHVEQSLLINIAHIIPVAILAYLLYVRTTLPLLLKLLISLSYFFCFEYSIINRGYIWVLVWVLVAILAIKEHKTVLFTLSLFLLCQIEVYAVFIAIALAWAYYREKGFSDLRPYISLSVGFLFFLVTVYPRSSYRGLSDSYNMWQISFSNLAKSFQGLLANTFTIGFIPDTVTYGYSAVGLLLSIVVLGIIIFLLQKERKALQMWAIGFPLLYLFSVLVFTGGARQWGFSYVLFTTIMIMYPSIFVEKKHLWLSTLLLIAPIIHNFKAILKDTQINFTNAKDAGEFIKNKIPENVAIVSLNKFETTSAAAYANRKLFEMPSGSTFTYFKWLEKVYVPTQSELMLFAKYKGAKGLVILAHEPVDQNRYPILKLWKSFDKENFKSEEFYFYVLNLSGRN
jgi:hypothetical protein